MQKARKPKRKSPWDRDKEKIAAAETVLRDSKSLSRDPERLLRSIAEGKPVKLPRRTDLGVIASLFEPLHRGDFAESPLQPDEGVLRNLVTFCRSETDLLTDHGASHFANALLALSARADDWVRPLDTWRARTHNARRQFQSLLRHLVARYDVPTFLDAAWLEGLTADGVRHQGWFKHLADGRNIRTANDLPIPLTRKQAHIFLQTPDDFDIPSAFRRALIVDLGGDERLVRSILATRLGTAFGDEEFWASVVRFFIAHPELKPTHHGPIIDFLHDAKFVPSVPNPHADQPGQPPLVPPQPNLSIKGRTPESLRRAVADWHRELAERQAAATAVGSWEPSGFTPFVREEDTEHGLRVYEVTELLTSQELFEEGKAMSHCVASYARSCASGRSSIWSLRVQIESGRVVRLATIEVRLSDRKIIQIRRRSNKPSTSRELSLLNRWEYVGGPGLTSWFST
jgi:PcfJ-like protein